MNRIAMTRVLALAAIAAVSATSHAAGDAAAGQAKAAACVACHGEGGKSTVTVNPVLAGQYATYIEQALKDYKSGARKNPIMAGMAAPLSDEDITNLAAYFSSQDSTLVTPSRR